MSRHLFQVGLDDYEGFHGYMLTLINKYDKNDRMGTKKHLRKSITVLSQPLKQKDKKKKKMAKEDIMKFFREYLEDLR